MALLRLNFASRRSVAFALAVVLSVSGWAQTAQSAPSALPQAPQPTPAPPPHPAVRSGRLFETALPVSQRHRSLQAGLRATAEPEQHGSRSAVDA